jgi:hypothetical protein
MKRPAIRLGPRLAGFPPDEPVTPAPSTPVKRGRPPKSGVAMTLKERKASSRMNQKAKKEDAERRNLIAKLVKIYDRQVSDVIVVPGYINAEAIAEDRRGRDRVQKRQYLKELKSLTLEELKLTVEGKNIPDTRGRLPGELKSGGVDSNKLGTILDVALKEMGGPDSIVTSVKPDGSGSDFSGTGVPSRWARVSTKELEKQSNLEEKFRRIATANFDSNGHCTVPNCSFTNSDSDAQAEHFWSEYYAGEKLWDKVDQLADPDVAEIAGPLLADARKNALANVHHWIICGWLRSRS